MTDEEIYTLVHEHNQDGLTSLLDKYGGLMTYVVRNTGSFNEEDISECISDILFTVWKRIRNYDSSKSSFKTWLVIITRGCAIDFLRKYNKHKNIVSLEELKELHFDTYTYGKLTDNSLIELLQELPPPDNDIFYRRFVLGESVAHIAQVLEVTQDGIYKRILRGKEKLKSLMSRKGYRYV